MCHLRLFVTSNAQTFAWFVVSFVAGPLEPSKDLMQDCAKWGDFQELVECFCDTPSSNTDISVFSEWA
jgi:hypothetical protein